MINDPYYISELERAYYVAVAETDGIGPKTFSQLLGYFSSAKNIWQATPRNLEKAGLGEAAIENLQTKIKTTHPKTHLKTLYKMNIRPVCWPDSEYPASLRTIGNPPPILFTRGKMLPIDAKAIGVVGTRKPTPYGRQVTESLVTQLVIQGFTIISGLAQGIDGIAHQTAIDQGGRTIAVLGGGPDFIYPAMHKNLAHQVMKQGAVISEFTPGFRPLRGQFPARNRVISGLSLGVLVIEGESSSGTKHTANHAIKQGRPVFAVPGPITSHLSDAPNDLIQAGAIAIRQVSDITKHLNMAGFNTQDQTISNPNKMLAKFDHQSEKTIYKALENSQLEVDEIVRLSKLNAQEVSAILSLMEIKGMVRNLGNGIYCRI